MADTTKFLSRRSVLKWSSASILLSSLGLGADPAHSQKTEWEQRVLDIVKDFKPVEGKVSITVPKLATHGAAVPIKITVDSPMTETDYVESISLMSNSGEIPTLANFYLSQLSGKAEVSTYLKLKANQELMALAKTNEGKFFIGRRQVGITIGREF